MELKDIKNSQDLETIPTDNTTEELQENVEQSTGDNEVIEVPEDNSAEIETEQERLRREHEEYLNSFPETTVFYRDLLVNGNVKSLGMATKDPHVADYYKILDNHYDESELTYIGSPECGTYYLKGHEKPAETPEEFIARRESEIVVMVQELIDSTAQQKRYDTGESCCSYVGDPDEEFNADAVAFQAWRGRCWRTCYNILNSVTAGTVPPEEVTDEYVLERLPVMEWPNV